MSTNKKGALHVSGDKLMLLAAIAVVFTLFTILSENFFSVINMMNTLIAASLVGSMTIGYAYLIIAGQNDLLPGSLAAFSGVMAVLLVGKGFSFSLAVLLAIACEIIIGCSNAFMISRIYFEVFIVTPAAQSIVRGFAYIICGEKPISVSSRNFLILSKVRIANIPSSVWIMVLCTVIFGIILARTKFGRSVYTIGGSMDAARLAGLDPKHIITTCYIMMGILCSIGGIIFAARIDSGQPVANVNLGFDTIAAVILGGVSFVGDVGNMGGTILGIILVQALSTGLTMVNVPTFWQYVAKGGLLLFALAADYTRKQRRGKELLAASIKNL